MFFFFFFFDWNRSGLKADIHFDHCGALSIKPKSPIQPVEMQMAHVVQMEIFQNKQTTF